jgi:hypothetical protein
MTVYEKMMAKIEHLKAAEARCIERGRLVMAFTWRKHQIDLIKNIGALPVSVAEMEATNA